MVAGKVVIFANEWLDALPFHRFRFGGGAWHEVGVRTDHSAGVREVALPGPTPALLRILPDLPPHAPEGYTLDLSLDAEDLLANLCAQRWNGLLLLVDYGHSWETLIHDLPAGSGRGYHRHRQVTDIYARPGEQDLTCSVCWDRLRRTVEACGFDTVRVRRQEAFLMEEASEAIATLLAEDATAHGGKLRTLLHPGHFGTSFQILSALRPKLPD